VCYSVVVRRPPDTEIIQAIVKLRRVEGDVDREAATAVTDARELLERLVGPTVRPATVARLFGVTPAALLPWMRRGEIASVVTPEGRREVPLAEVVDLAEDIECVRQVGAARPIAKVISERARQAAEDIDVDRLLPRRRRGHRVAEQQSLAYHRLIAERLDERMVGEARRRLKRWRTEGRLHPHWLEAWERLLTKSLPQIAKEIGADTRRARELRQSSPFAGMLNEQERRHLQRTVESRSGA
jgi:hypothetical protein